jgi:hypothetical protein
MLSFFVYWIASAVFTMVMFEVSQRLSVAAGQIPARGIHMWQGKPFLHWNAFACQKYGDFIFLSGLNAAVIVGMHRVKLTSGQDYAVLGMIVGSILTLGILSAIAWVVSVKKQFARGIFDRWDWGFTAPAGKLTIAGWFHLVYFAIEASVVCSAALYLLWKPIGLWIRVFMVLCIIGYAITVIYDAKKIGMSGGPFGATRLTKK